jgi:chaperonin GroEL
MQRGINKIANLIRPTLGPRPRVVAVEHPLRHRTPELLDCGAIIAQRVVELPDRDEDMGAMFLRHVVLHLHDQVGDGTATAAVLLQSTYNQGIRYVTAGGNAMRLRHYLEQGMRAILAEMDGMVVSPRGKKQLAQIASAVCYDPPMAKMMGEIFDIIGEYGRLEIHSGQSRGLEREYVEGMYWKGGFLSREMIVDQKRLRTEIENAAILITDLEIQDPAQLVPVIERAMQAQCSGLLVIAQKLSGSAIALLLANSKPDDGFHIAAVQTPGTAPTERGAALLDMVMLTGGNPFLVSAGHKTLDGIQLEDLGRARTAWVGIDSFGIIGGKGDPRALRRHIVDLRDAHSQAQDIETRQGLQQRIGKLMGGSAILWVGGSTKTEVATRRKLAKRTAEAMRGAIIGGVLPGGGISLLACRPALERLREQAADVDERAAYEILIRSMEEPTRAIAANAGLDPSVAMARLALAGPGYGYDVISEQIVDMVEAGIFDVAVAQKAAIHAAVTGAALALTTDVLVHHKSVNWYKPRDGKW